MQKVIVAEACVHPTVLEHQYFLFKKNYLVSFLVPPDKNNSYTVLMPNVMKNCNVHYSFHSTTVFLTLLVYGFFYDHISISTGPEHSHISTLWSHPLFFLCCFIHRKKVILTVKNSRSYFEYKNSFNLLHYSLKYVRRIMFETCTLKKYFKKNLNYSFLSTTVYNKYTDLLPVELVKKPLHFNRTKIGLLGSLDDSRRDYKTFLEVLESLEESQLRNITIELLGYCEYGKENPILNKLQKYVNVNYPTGYISAHDFDVKGTDCSILFSPLLPSMEYGTYKGTGAISDAIYLRRNIILPEACDPCKEFDDIAYYYSTKNDLINIFSDVKSLSKRPVSPNFLKSFSTENVLRKVSFDLKL